MFNFNFSKVFQYLNVGSAVLAVIASAGNPQNLGDAVTLLTQIATTVSPGLANDKNFQTIQNVLKVVAAAEASGTPGQIGEVPFSSHGTSRKLIFTIE